MPCVAANNTLPTSLLDQDPLYLPAASLDGFDSAALAPILGSTPPHELGPAVKRTLTERCRPLLASSVGAPSNRILSLHAVLREPIPHARLLRPSCSPISARVAPDSTRSASCLRSMGLAAIAPNCPAPFGRKTNVCSSLRTGCPPSPSARFVPPARPVGAEARPVGHHLSVGLRRSDSRSRPSRAAGN